MARIIQLNWQQRIFHDELKKVHTDRSDQQPQVKRQRVDAQFEHTDKINLNNECDKTLDGNNQKTNDSTILGPTLFKFQQQKVGPVEA